ncbi:MAG: elongation factor P hydroxylase [Alphaproteobacteria bacterium]|jgi:elongation factor P hydroxylase
MLANSPLHKQNKPKSDCDLQSIFSLCFSEYFNAQLQGNALEPLYTPANAKQTANTIFYRHDYFSSALHEIAHWCIAGNKRREQIDYGYWYAPDGRTAQQQNDFELVERKPQALEWAFSIACNIPFRVSIDNLNAQDDDEEASADQEHKFTQAVNRQLTQYVKQGFPARASIFLTQLHSFYSTQPLSANDERLSVAALHSGKTL